MSARGGWSLFLVLGLAAGCTFDVPPASGRPTFYGRRDIDTDATLDVAQVDAAADAPSSADRTPGGSTATTDFNGRLIDAGARDCGAGLTACGGACVDLLASGAHCGGCGRACSVGMVCSGGSCACPAGTTLCGSGDVRGCVDTSTSVAACGGCGLACVRGPNVATVACAMGACVTTCGAGFADCDHDASNGCEVDTQSDPAHCGACGGACDGGSGCVSGRCL